MELICSRMVHVGEKKGIGGNNRNILRGFIHWKTEGHMLFLWEKELRSQSLGGQKGLGELTSSLWVLERDSCTATASSKVADISSNCCFMAVPLRHLSKPSQPDLRELAVHESVWVCIFFYTARLNMNIFQSTAKQRGETDREERLRASEIHHPLIETFLKTDTSAHIVYPSSPSCCYPYSHVQIKLHCRTDNWKP